MEVQEPAVKYYPKMSSTEYLIWEREQKDKHEYIEGSIFAMGGASPRHNLILSNIIREVATYLKGKSCNIFPSDLKVFVKSKDSYFYPDATIVCGDISLSDDKLEAVKNPEVIFEILSPSTEDFDLGRKFFFYMQIDSLKQYITIDSQTRNIRTGIRQPDNAWKFEELTTYSTLFIPSINFELSLSEIYDGINL